MKNRSAFTLIETILAITLTTLVITAVAGLILSTLSANSRNLRTLQATFLAQEGLEAVRYMRDSNWLQNYSWDEAADLWGQDFHVEGSTLTLYLVPKMCTGVSPCFALSSISTDGILDEDGSAGIGDGFEFQRTLTFSPVTLSDGTVQLSALELECTVSWEEHGNESSVSLSTNLTDWK